MDYKGNKGGADVRRARRVGRPGEVGGAERAGGGEGAEAID